MKHIKLFESFNTTEKIDIANHLINKYLADKEVPILIPKIFDKIGLKSITKGDTTSYYIEKKELEVKSTKIQDEFYDLFIHLYEDSDNADGYTNIFEYRELPILNVMNVNKVADDEIQIYDDFFYFIESMFSTYSRLTIYLTRYSKSSLILRDSIKQFIAKIVSIDEKKINFVKSPGYRDSKNFPFVAQSQVHDIKQNLTPWKKS